MLMCVCGGVGPMYAVWIVGDDYEIDSIDLTYINIRVFLYYNYNNNNANQRYLNIIIIS